MIVVESLGDGRTLTHSDSGFKIEQIDTGNIYDEAVDIINHEYRETDIPIEQIEEATEEDYQHALGEFGVSMDG